MFPITIRLAIIAAFCVGISAQSVSPPSGGGGTGTVTTSGNPTTNQIPKFTGSAVIGNSSLSDNGTTSGTTEQFFAPSFTTNGTGSGLYTFSGSTSGSAAISVAAAAGTPSTILLPTTDPGAANYFLQNSAPSGGSMQTAWTNSPVLSGFTNTGTETTPSTTGGIPILIACGTTSGATANCANTNVGATAKIYFGKATLASNASTITLSPGFTSTSTFYCEGNDVTTRANPVQVVPASATTITITDTTGATDGIQWVCQGY